MKGYMITVCTLLGAACVQFSHFGYVDFHMKYFQNFSRNQGSDKYCLVHLFTAQSFENGVLGLAYISSPELDAAGGICSVQVIQF